MSPIQFENDNYTLNHEIMLHKFGISKMCANHTIAYGLYIILRLHNVCACTGHVMTCQAWSELHMYNYSCAEWGVHLLKDGYRLL